MVVPGADQMDFLAAAFEAGMFPDIEGTTEDYIAQRRRRQHELRRAVEIHFSSGLWVQVNERPTHGGGFAAVYTDITERKEAEKEIAKKEAQLRIATDIAARKQTEDKLQESRERLRALADNLPEFISMKDPEGRFLFVNKRFEEWACQSRDDVIGKTVFDIYSDDQAKYSTPWTSRRLTVGRPCRTRSTSTTPTARRGPSFAPGSR